MTGVQTCALPIFNDAFRQVSDLKTKELLDRRYERLQSYGRFNDTKADTGR